MALALYREALRGARDKAPELRRELELYAREEFETHRSIDRKNYQLIEHFLRVGKRKIDMLKAPEVTSFHR